MKSQQLSELFVKFERNMPVECAQCGKPIMRRKEAVIEEDQGEGTARALHTKCYFNQK